MVEAHWALIRGSIRAQRAYPVSFFLLMLTMLLATALDFLTIAIIFGRLDRLGGFSLYQVGLLYGISSVAFGLTDAAVGSLDVLPDMVRQGTFDVVLLRPLGALFQVASTEFALRRLGKMVQGAAVLALSLSKLQVQWTLPRVGMMAMVFVTAPLLFGSIWTIAMSHVFWTVDTGEISNAFTYGGNFMTSYPIGIFARWLRDLVAFIIPLAFVAYYPVLFILELPDPVGLPAWVALLTPLIALVMLLLARLAWGQGVRHYQGTGS